jgi:hypothetical protein
MELGLRFCVSDKLPSDVDGSGAGTTPGTKDITHFEKEKPHNLPKSSVESPGCFENAHYGIQCSIPLVYFSNFVRDGTINKQHNFESHLTVDTNDVCG